MPAKRFSELLDGHYLLDLLQIDTFMVKDHIYRVCKASIRRSTFSAFVAQLVQMRTAV